EFLRRQTTTPVKPLLKVRQTLGPDALCLPQTSLFETLPLRVRLRCPSPDEDEGSQMADDQKHGHEFGSIEQQALEHVWIHSARWLDLAERDGLRVMVRGEGCRLFDARGRSYLDGLAGLYVINVGHGRIEIAEAMAQQARELAYVSAASYTNLAAVQLAD